MTASPIPFKPGAFTAPVVDYEPPPLGVGVPCPTPSPCRAAPVASAPAAPVDHAAPSVAAPRGFRSCAASGGGYLRRRGTAPGTGGDRSTQADRSTPPVADAPAAGHGVRADADGGPERRRCCGECGCAPPPWTIATTANHGRRGVRDVYPRATCPGHRRPHRSQRGPLARGGPAGRIMKPMQGNTVRVERLIKAPAREIFALLADAGRHSSFDGSGTVDHATAQSIPLELGTKFSMRMRGRPETLFMPYTMSNKVVEFEPDRRIAWQPTVSGAWSADASGGTNLPRPRTELWSAKRGTCQRTGSAGISRWARCRARPRTA